MPKFSDEERDEILRTSYRLLDELRDFAPEPRDDSLDEDIERLRRLRPEPEPPPPERQLDTAPPVDWSTVIDERIEAAIERHHKYTMRIVGTALGQSLADGRKDTMRELRESLRETRVEVAKLASECAELRAALAREKSTTVDLPAWPAREPREIN
jgi:hypothetical protein